MYKKLLYLCIATLPFVGIVAHADTIGPSCGSCFGSIYTLTDTTTANPGVFDVFLTVNTTGFTGTSTDLLNAVALKLTSQASDLTSIQLLSAPSTFTTVLSTGLNANGCTGPSGGFFCIQSTGLGVPLASPGDIYNFSFAVTLASGSSFLSGPGAASVKALYVTSTGKQNGLTSEAITLTPAPVPEPSTLVLMGTGLLGLALVSRKLVS